MNWVTSKCVLASMLLLTGVLVTNLAVALAEDADDLDTLAGRVVGLYDQGKYAEATPVAEQALGLAERAHGNEHPKTLNIASNLAALYMIQGRYDGAEQLFKRVLEVRERVLGRDHPDALTSINFLAQLFLEQGRYGDAKPLFMRVLEVRERVLGKEHPDTLISINNLALLHLKEGRYGDAEPLFRRAAEACERTLGEEHTQTLLSINNLAHLYENQGRYNAAEPLYQRVLDVRERLLGEEHPKTLLSANNLAMLYYYQGRYDEAERLRVHALRVQERVLGKDHPETLTSLNNLAALYRAQGRFGMAEPLYQRALEASERVLGKEHPDTVGSINNLATLYSDQSRSAEAEALCKRALDAYERVLGYEHPQTLTSVSNLADLYRNHGRYDEAEPLFKRVLEARERVLGQEHPDTVDSVHNLALLYHDRGRVSEAKPLYQRVLETRERVLGQEHPDTLASASNLASILKAQGIYGEAERLYKRPMEALERVLGQEHPATLGNVINLAELYYYQGRYSEAEALFQRAFEASQRVFGEEHFLTLISVNFLAVLHFAQSDWARAEALWRRSTAALVKRPPRGAQETVEVLTGMKSSGRAQDHWQFQGLVKTASRLSAEGNEAKVRASHETFQTAQWAMSSEAAQSLAQIAARGAAATPELAAILRERQDLVAEWHARDALRNAALARMPEQRNARAEAETLTRLAIIDVRVAAIDKQLGLEFPDYAALASPQPISVEEVQAQLGADEALALFLDTPKWQPTPEESFIWVVTKTDMRWVRSDLGTAALTHDVQALRCGLDAEAWLGQQCTNLVGGTYEQADALAGKPLPFDHARAHRLYKGLFGEVEDLIKGKHLLIVPSGPLTQLPFQVLVTAPPGSEDYRNVRWLTRDHALTVLPAVSSLKALRRAGRVGAAPRPMIGFGNPLLDGEDRRYAKSAQLALAKQSCAQTLPEHIAARADLRGRAASVQTRSGLADPLDLRRQAPLPETADELCAVARSVHADMGEIRLGARATEREVKAMSDGGTLAQYRIVHFATHGVASGQLDGAGEPGLILTPPEKASTEDDGYLSGPEVASLKLNADWVILSACNTAAGNAQNAETLSGLTRAFIYAQARALLVSHWAVDSNATVKLITAAVDEISRDPNVGRAEALRRAMLKLIDDGEPHESHPAYWAPFIIVGEGAQ